MNIGETTREIICEPIQEPAGVPVQEPVPGTVEPAPEREKEPVGV